MTHRHTPLPGLMLTLSHYLATPWPDANIWRRPPSNLEILFIMTVNNDSETSS
jgi:hypothetical protein